MDTDTEALIERFWQAFNDRDPDAIAALMTGDAILETSFGPDVWGIRVIGPEAIRAFYTDMFERIPDTHWDELRRMVGPTHVALESTHTGTPRGGTRFESMVCDLLSLRDGKIAAKRSYRKTPAI